MTKAPDFSLITYAPVKGTPLSRTLTDAINMATGAIADTSADEIALRGTLREIRSVLRTALTYEGMAR